MRCLLLTLALMLPLFAQQPPEGRKKGPAGPPKNLKILKADTNIRETMMGFRAALGVQCTGCHVQGDFAADDNPHKEIARKMIVMTEEINAKFPDGKVHVTCFTCHRGEEHPQKDAPMPAGGPGGGAGAAAPKPQ